MKERMGHLESELAREREREKTPAAWLADLHMFIPAKRATPSFDGLLRG